MVEARWNGKLIAQSDDTVVVEGNHYFPAESVVEGILRPSETKSVCGWKGEASYYSLDVNGAVNEDAAWFYPDPLPEAANIKGRLAFWKGVSVEG